MPYTPKKFARSRELTCDLRKQRAWMHRRTAAEFVADIVTKRCNVWMLGWKIQAVAVFIGVVHGARLCALDNGLHGNGRGGCKCSWRWRRERLWCNFNALSSAFWSASFGSTWTWLALFLATRSTTRKISSCRRTSKKRRACYERHSSSGIVKTQARIGCATPAHGPCWLPRRPWWPLHGPALHTPWLARRANLASQSSVPPDAWTCGEARRWYTILAAGLRGPRTYCLEANPCNLRLRPCLQGQCCASMTATETPLQQGVASCLARTPSNKGRLATWANNAKK